MKKKIIAASLCLSLVLPTVAFADVAVSSTLEFNFSGFQNSPAPSFYGYSDGYYGSVYYYDGSNYSYPWSPNGMLNLDTSTYQDSRSGSYGTVSASWNPTTGAGSLSLLAIDNDPGILTTTNIGLGMGAPFRYLGPYTTLPEFSYSYILQGSKDSVDEFIAAAVQIELGYTYQDETGRNVDVRLYSDYGDYGHGFRTNWVYEHSDAGDSDLSYYNTGTRTFNGYSTLDGQERLWFIEYGFSAVGFANKTMQDTPIPEPATLALTGLGLLSLLGVAALRRREASPPTA